MLNGYRKFLCFFVVWAAADFFTFQPVCANLFSKVFMPGKLSSGHAKYEDDCHNCHSNFGKSVSQRRLCLDCHKKVAKDIKSKTGFHGRSQQITIEDCDYCHTEHKGRRFNIMLFDRNLFSHKITDFFLKGRHRKVNCVSCHAKNSKYRDAPGQCFNCHKKSDYHRGNLGRKCEDCHNETGWSSFRFDHNLTRYPLQGRHAEVTCMGCHPERKYKGTPEVCGKCHKSNDIHGGRNLADCAACHTPFSWKKSAFSHTKPLYSGNKKISDCLFCHSANDAHKGVFGVKCGSCHRSSKWKPATFDHSVTEFNLAGKHVFVECEACHLNPLSEKKAPVECVECHRQIDEHNGFFGEKCNTCHSANGWEGALFNHDNTRFKLTGKHLKLSCSLCHRGDVYKDPPGTGCAVCHRFDDAHNARYGAVCGPCHTTKGWDNPVFNHETSVISKTVSKALRECSSCYIERLGKPCYGCHASNDIHSGKEGEKCGNCHNTGGWEQKVFFEHDMTNFPLLGMHAVALCEGCHLDQAFKGLTTECVDCHKADDRHKGRMGEKCAVCHNPNGWKYWIFDHFVNTRFPLDGVHEELKCVACHKDSLNGEISLERACSSCHMKESVHSGRYWIDCSRCHTARSFKDIFIKK